MKISPVVFPVLRLQALACAHLCSMSLKSGLYGGRYSRVCPAALIRVLCYLACGRWRGPYRYGFGGQPGDQVMFKPEVEDVGINIGFDQPHAQQNPGGERPDDIDPAFGIPVMLPGAAPGQPCPRGAYPSVRGMSWAKPLSSISTMGRASRS